MASAAGTLHGATKNISALIKYSAKNTDRGEEAKMMERILHLEIRGGISSSVCDVHIFGVKNHVKHRI